MSKARSLERLSPTSDDALQNGSRAPREEDVEARASLAQTACASFLANERKLDMFTWPAHVCMQRVSAGVAYTALAHNACKGTGWPSVLPLRFLYASCHVVKHGQSSSTVFVQAVLRPPVYVGLGPTSCLEALLPPRFPTSCASLHLPLSGASPPGVTPGQWRVRPLAEGALRPGKAGAAQRARHSAPVDASLQAAVLVHLFSLVSSDSARCCVLCLNLCVAK